MNRNITRWIGTVAALGALLAVPACDRDDHDDDHEDLAVLEVRDRTQPGQPVVATWTHDGGWTGALPELTTDPEDRLSLGFNALTSDGDPLQLEEDGEFFIQYWTAPGAPTGIIDTGRDDLFHGDHVHVYALLAGTTQIQFELWHVDHVEDATTPIEVVVTEPEEG